jgi:filamentous hemagglutinin family protein
MGIASEAVTDKLYMPINKVCVAVRRGATQIQRGVRLGCIALLSLSVNLHAAPGIDALPSGGNISAGNGTISSQGNQMLIHQVSDKLAINWSSYNIGANASVTYQQPNSQAIALNRILSADPSQIYGRLNANGQVIFVNPNGVVFGPGARVDVGAMIVSTLDLSDSDFMSSNYRFTTPSTDGLANIAWVL